MSLLNNTLTQRIARRILGITLLTLCIASVIIAANVYLGERARMEILIGQIEKSFVWPIAESVWLVDQPQLESQLKAMTQIPGIAHVAVSTFVGQQFHFDGGEHDHHDNFMVRKVSLEHQGRPLGSLEIAASRSVLIQAVIDHLLQMLSIQAGILALGGIALYLTVNREVTRPLAHIARQTAAYAPNEDPLPLLSFAPGKPSDELAALTASFNLMQQTIALHLKDERNLRVELSQHRDQLAELVEKREHTLSYLEGMEHRILMMSTGLISLPHDQIIPEIRRSLSDIGQYAQLDYVGLFQNPRDNDAFEIQNFWLAENMVVQEHPTATAHRELARWIRLRLATRAVERIDGLAKNKEAPGTRAALAEIGFVSLIAIPLLVRDSSHGLLVMAAGTVGRRMLEQDAQFFELIGQIVASALTQQKVLLQLATVQHNLEVANEELGRMSRTDALTSLPNRRAFDEIKEREFSRARRGDAPLTLVLLDVDHFKAYNDTLGHLEGDACLTAIAGQIRGIARRAGDLAARIGGEEFALLLPDTDAHNAWLLIEELSKTLATLNLPHPASPAAPYVTLSAGLAEYKAELHPSFDALYAACDKALYAAKHQGRNRCVTSGQEPDTVAQVADR